jgi:hypothetical protein
MVVSTPAKVPLNLVAKTQKPQRAPMAIG